MTRIESQKGQALILIAFGIIALIGFTALAVDGGRVFSDRRNAQNAADTSALAAALAQIREDYGIATAGYEQSGLDRAESNGYINDPPTSTVTVEFCDDAASAGDPCTELPAGANPSEYIRVVITSQVRMTFARVLGREFVTNRVEAVARVQGTLNNNIFNAGAGLYSVRNDNSDDCFKVNGSANLTLHDTGVFVNCSGASALFLNGSAQIGMDANAQVAGCTNNINFPITGTGQIDCGVAPQTVTESTFDDIPTTLPAPTCSAPGSHNSSTDTMFPGYFSSSVTLSSNTTFNPGAYCFVNGAQLRLIAGSSISGTGTVQLVLAQDLSLRGTSNNFNDLEIYVVGADFSVTGTLNANRLRFFSTGSGSFNLGAQAVLNSDDAYFYTESGTIEFDAQASANLHAPLPGDTFGGLLIYMPWSNTNPFELNGGTNNTWYGTVLVPHSDVTYNGSSGFTLYGQVIGYTFKINGDGGSDIFFDSSVSFNPPSDPTIEFTK